MMVKSGYFFSAAVKLGFQALEVTSESFSDDIFLRIVVSGRAK